MSLSIWVPSSSSVEFLGVSLSGDNAIGYDWRGSLYYSSDAGYTWTKSLTPSFKTGIQDISLSGSKGIFAAKGVGTVWYTTDAGVTWQQNISTGPNEPTLINSISISGDNAVAIQIAGNLYYSTNGGQSWTWNVSIFGIGWFKVNLDQSNPLLGVAATQSFQPVYKTTDGGQSWTPTSIAILGHSWQTAAISNGDILAVSDEGAQNVYLSTDGGTVFNNIIPADILSVNFATISLGNIVGWSGYGYDFYSDNFGVSWVKYVSIPQTRSRATLSGSKGIFYLSDTDPATIFIAPAPPAPPCFTSEALVQVSTTKEEIKISELKQKDKILNALSSTNQFLTVKHVHVHKVDLSQIEPENVLYKIPASHFGENVPNKDLIISGHHRIVFQNKKESNHFHGEQAFKLLGKEFIEQDQGKIFYFNVEVEEGKSVMIVNGLGVETM